MDVDTFMVPVSCWMDETAARVAATPLRPRGPAPTLSDREVLTMLLVGAYEQLGHDTDVGIDRAVRRHDGAWVPALGQVHRTPVARQAANLWSVVARLHGWLLDQSRCDSVRSLVDRLPLPVGRFARASRCRRRRGAAAYGGDAVARPRCQGLRGPVRSGWPGVIGTTSLAPASVQDLWVAEADSRDQAAGQVLGDRTDWSPTVREGLAAAGMHLLAPRKTTRPGPHPWPVWLTLLRRRVDTVISQLVARSHAKRVWARDAWQLTAR